MNPWVGAKHVETCVGSKNELMLCLCRCVYHQYEPLVLLLDAGLKDVHSSLLLAIQIR